MTRKWPFDRSTARTRWNEPRVKFGPLSDLRATPSLLDRALPSLEPRRKPRERGYHAIRLAISFIVRIECRGWRAEWGERVDILRLLDRFRSAHRSLIIYGIRTGFER